MHLASVNVLSRVKMIVRNHDYGSLRLKLHSSDHRCLVLAKEGVLWKGAVS